MQKVFVVRVDGMVIPFRDEDFALAYVRQNGGTITIEWR